MVKSPIFDIVNKSLTRNSTESPISYTWEIITFCLTRPAISEKTLLEEAGNLIVDQPDKNRQLHKGKSELDLIFYSVCMCGLEW